MTPYKCLGSFSITIVIQQAASFETNQTLGIALHLVACLEYWLRPNSFNLSYFLTNQALVLNLCLQVYHVYLLFLLMHHPFATSQSTTHTHTHTHTHTAELPKYIPT